MWLCAGITSLSFKYSNYFKVIVIKLKQRSQSAGNFINNSHKLINKKTSETLRYKSTESEYIHKISIHVPKHLKPVNENEFGHYLAGLIDGDGHFSSKQQLVIAFNISDISLAYYIKQRLGYGSIRKVNNKNAVLLIIAAKKGIEKVIYLINKKIRTENKLNQIIKNILNHSKYSHLNELIVFELNEDTNLKNH